MPAFFRKLRMLQLIPRSPRSITSTQLRNSLEAEDDSIHLRSVQRDLLFALW